MPMTSETPTQFQSSTTTVAATLPITLPGTPASSGNSFIFLYWAQSVDVNGLSIAQTNVTWARKNTPNTTNQRVEIWLGTPTGAGTPSTTATLTLSGTPIGGIRGYLGEWPDVLTFNSTSTGSIGNSTTVLSGTITPSTGIKAFIVTASRKGSSYVSGPTNSFVALTTGSQTQRSDVLFISSTSGTYSTSWTGAVASAWGDEYVVFSVPGSNVAPTATITAPTSGLSVVVGSTVTFTGTATDPEDGALTGSSLVWTSSINGTIGTGVSVSSSTLSIGTHTITLTATDSGLATDIKSITLIVHVAGIPFRPFLFLT